MTDDDEQKPEQGSDRWLAERRTGIGGSEVSALYTLPDGRCAHPWLSPLKLWALKTGRLPDPQPTPQEAPHLYVGRVLEKPVREMYEAFSGRTVSDGVTLLRDSQSPVMLASTDGKQVCPARDVPGVYEGKVTTVFRRSDWIERLDDDGEVKLRELVPLHYQCQVQHYMACTDLSWASVVCFMQADAAPIHWRDVDRHEKFIDDMRERTARWWRDHVHADVPPAIDDSEATETALREMHSKAEKLAVLLPASFAAVYDRLEAIAEFSKLLKKEKQRLRNILLSTMGSAALAIISDDGRGWSLRGEERRSLRAMTQQRLARVGKEITTTRVVYVPHELGRELDAIYNLNARAFAPGSSLSAKAVHLAHLAAAAATNIASE
jgi:predicted phage-related endonuclease